MTDAVSSPGAGGPIGHVPMSTFVENGHSVKISFGWKADIATADQLLVRLTLHFRMQAVFSASKTRLAARGPWRLSR